MRKWIGFLLALRTVMATTHFKASDGTPYNMEVVFILGYFNKKELWLPETLSGQPQDVLKLKLDEFKEVSDGYLQQDEAVFKRALKEASMKDPAVHRMLQSKTKAEIYKSLEDHPIFPRFRVLQAKLDGHYDEYEGSRAIADLMTEIGRAHV